MSAARLLFDEGPSHVFEPAWYSAQRGIVPSGGRSVLAVINCRRFALRLFFASVKDSNKGAGVECQQSALAGRNQRQGNTAHTHRLFGRSLSLERLVLLHGRSNESP